MNTVALIGDYSVSNYGDRLYPDVIEAFLRADGCDLPIELFAPVAGCLPGGRRVRSIAELPGFSLRAALVGGGDLVRTDYRTVAHDHLNVAIERRRSPAARARAELFARRLLRPGPWLPARGWRDDVPAAYVSVGVHKLPDSEPVRRSLSEMRYAWVRSPKGRDWLIGAGLEADRCVLGPDAIFALSDIVDFEQVRDTGRALLRDATGSADPVAVVQAAPFTGWNGGRIASLLSALALSMRVVALPLGRYCGEDVMLRHAAAEAGVPCLEGLAADNITAVLAAAGCLVSTSMHAAIVARCFGRPVVVPGVDKTRAAFAACPEPPSVIEVGHESVAAAVRESLGQELSLSASSNAAAARAAFRRVASAVGLAPGEAAPDTVHLPSTARRSGLALAHGRAA